MAGDRVVKVSLTAQVSNYLAGMEQARKATADVGTSAESAKAQLEEQNDTMTSVGTGLLAMGGIAAVGVGLAISKFAEFDQAMSEVQASTHASAADMSLLSAAAIDAGATTVFTATEAANAIDELSKAGISTADVLGGALAGSLDLASAGGLGVADAATIAATALTQFKLKGADIPHVADLLAAGAGKASGSVEDLAAALNQGGLVAAQAGFSIEDTTGTLAAFAAAGLSGSDAGTSLKTAILALEKPSTIAQAAMDEYGISVYDSNGKMDSFSEIAGTLQSKLGNLTDEQRNSTLATIFGTDAVRSAAVLYDQGAKGIADWNEKVNDSGYAAETARLKLDNLNGDVEKLGGAFDTALIKTGAAADGAMRGLTQTITGLVDIFNGSPPIVQNVALALGVVVAAATLTGGAFLVAVPQIASFNAALVTLSNSTIPAVASKAIFLQGAIVKSGAAMAATATFMTGPWGLALAAVAVGVAVVVRALDSMKASSGEIGNSLTTATSAAQIFATIGKGRELSSWQNVTAQLKDLPKILQASAEQSGNLFARFDSTNFGAFKALKDLGTELGTLASTDLPGAQHAFQMLSAETDGSEKSQWRLLNAMPAYKDALADVATQQDVNVTSTDEAANKTAYLGLAFGDAAPAALIAADAYLAASDEASGLNDQIRTLIEAMDESNNLGSDAVSTNARYRGSMADISEEVERQKDEFKKLQEEGYLKTHETLGGFKATLDGFTLSLDESTASGSANAEMLTGVADNARTAALAQFEVDKTTMSAKDATDKYMVTMGLSREELRKTAEANGYNAGEVQTLIDKVLALPTEKEVKIIADTTAAAEQIQHIKDIIATVPGAVAIGPGVKVLDPFGLPKLGRAHGGILPGAPSSVDNMFIHAAGGEFVTRASQTAIPDNRRALEFMNNGGVIRGYANGGEVTGFTGYATPVQYAPQGGGWGGGGSSVVNHNTADTFQISTPADPVAVAQAVQRRKNMRGAV